MQESRARGSIPFEGALAAYRAGVFSEARQIIDGVLESVPTHAAALHLRGVIEYQEGRHREAVLALRGAHAAAPHDRAYQRTLAVALVAAGRPAEAVPLFESLARASTDPPKAHTELGHALQAIGDTERARAAYERALALDSDAQQAHFGLSQLLHPGPCYLEILEALHDYLRPSLYLEIGVESGQTLSLAGGDTHAVGVDPAPQILYPLSTRAEVVCVTSDDFFETDEADKRLGDQPIDLGFIDGLHLFEQALRDFMHMEQRAARDSVILVHDCSPLDAATSARERRTTFWSGDVWKLIPCLRRLRPDLSIITVGAAPTGLGVITGLDPTSTLLADHYGAIIDEYIPQDFSNIENRRQQHLGLVPSDPAWVCDWLERQWQRRLH